MIILRLYLRRSYMVFQEKKLIKGDKVLRDDVHLHMIIKK